MLAPAAPAHESDQLAQLEKLLPHWREVPLYRQSLADCRQSNLECFRRLPLLGKPAMRENFPHNFLGDHVTLDSLLAQNLIEDRKSVV